MTKRNIFIGCGVLSALGFLLVLAVFVNAVVSGGGSSKSPPASDSEQDKPTKKSEAKKSGPENVTANVGEPAYLQDRTLVVNEVERNHVPPGPRPRQPEFGNEFVRLYITLTNTGNQSFNYNVNNFKVQDSSGVQRPSETFTQLPYRVSHGSLAPGGTLEGNMVFEVPQGDSGLRLVYEPFERRNLGTVTVTL